MTLAGVHVVRPDDEKGASPKACAEDEEAPGARQAVGGSPAQPCHNEKDSLLGTPGKKVKKKVPHFPLDGAVIGKGLGTRTCDKNGTVEIPQRRRSTVLAEDRAEWERAKERHNRLRWAASIALCVIITVLASTVLMLILRMSAHKKGKAGRASAPTPAVEASVEDSTTTTTSTPAAKVTQAERLARLFDASCVIEIDTLSEGWQITAESSRFRLQSQNHSSEPEKQLDRYLQSHPLLCRIKTSRTTSQGSGFALLSLADTWSYILQTKKHSLRLWEGLAARLQYAELHEMKSYISLGRLPFSELGFHEGDEVPESNCSDEGQSFHVMKAIATLRLLELDSDLEAVAYVDADTIPANRTITPTSYLSLHPDADFIATSNQRKPILVNGGVWILRNTAWGKRLMQKWWANRCGFPDQGALWHSLFELWAAEVEDFKYDPQLFESYDSVRPALLQKFADSTALQTDALARSSFSCRGKCWEVLSSTGCLTEALLVPRVLILPVLPIMIQGRGGVVFPVFPMQHHMGTAQWICHYDTVYADRLCRSRDASAFDVVNTADMPEDPTAYRCREGQVGRFGYVCDCQSVLKPGHFKSKKGKKR